MTRFDHILVPVDFEQSSEEATDVAVDLALAFDARLTLMHAWDVPLFAYAGSNSFMTADMWTPVERAATEQLASTLAVLRKRLPRAESVLSRGSPAVEALAVAGREIADIIVMGTHGRRGLERVLLGERKNSKGVRTAKKVT